MPIQIADLATRYPDLGPAIANLGTSFFGGYDRGRKMANDMERDRLVQEAIANSPNGQPSFQQMASIAFRTGQTSDVLQALGLAGQFDQRAAQTELARQELAMKQRRDQREEEASRGWNQMLGLGGGQQPVAGQQTNGMGASFLSTLQQGGLTNPSALAAVGATGQRESGWDAKRGQSTWADPSESGVAGTSGGALSWRGDRLAALQNYALKNGEQGNGSESTQAKYFMQENPDLIARLQAAKSPEEAMNLMNNAWRFAGYNRPGQGEHSARMAAVKEWAGRVAPGAQNANYQQPPAVQVAQARTSGGPLGRLSDENLAAAASNQYLPEPQRRMAMEELTARRQMDAEKRREEQQRNQPPQGYKRGEDGGLTFEPGGPADPATIAAHTKARVKDEAKPLPEKAISSLSEVGTNLGNIDRYASTFNDGYAGYKSQFVGEAANTLARNVGVGNKEGATWWQDYDRHKNQIRNQLFGSALTKTESAAFEKADINPGMTPKAVRANLEIQKQAAKSAAKKLAGVYNAQGRSQSEIEAAIGYTLQDIGVAPKKEAKPSSGQQLRTSTGVSWGAWDE